MAVDMKLTSFEREIKRANKMLNHIQKDQIPFATAIATTSLVGALRSPYSRAGKTLPKSGVLQNQQQSMRRELHRPIKYTLDGFEALPSNKKMKPIQARFGFREFTSKGTPSHKYLSPNIFGGRRNLKRHEVRLKNLGILPSGQVTAPGRDAPVATTGNLPGSFYTKVLAGAGALGENSSTRSSKKRNKGQRGYYVARKGGRPVGIRRYQGGQSQQLLNFIRSPNYRRRYDYYGIAEDFVRKNGARRFRIALEIALRTARTR